MNKKIIISVILVTLLTYSLFPLIYTAMSDAFLEVPDCALGGSLQEDQMVGNAGCLIIKGEEILLVKLSAGGEYTIPGGSSQKSEKAACTAHRETYEEAGIHSIVLERVFIADNGFQIFLCEARGEIDLNYRKKYEIDEIRFAPVDAIVNYRYPGQLEEIKEYIANR